MMLHSETCKIPDAVLAWTTWLISLLLLHISKGVSSRISKLLIFREPTTRVKSRSTKVEKFSMARASKHGTMAKLKERSTLVTGSKASQKGRDLRWGRKRSGDTKASGRKGRDMGMEIRLGMMDRSMKAIGRWINFKDKGFICYLMGKATTEHGLLMRCMATVNTLGQMVASSRVIS